MSQQCGGLKAVPATTVEPVVAQLQVRGPAPLQYFGDMLWAPAFEQMSASKLYQYIDVKVSSMSSCVATVVQAWHAKNAFRLSNTCT